VSRRLEGDRSRFNPQGEADPKMVAQLIGPADANGHVRAQAGDPRIVDVVRSLLGNDDVRLFGNQALMKPAHHGSPVSWHQDSGYWEGFVHDLDPPTIVTAWVAIDPVTEDNGCVRMVAGSHRAGPLPHAFHEDDLMRHVEGVGLEAAVPIVLPRGGVSFHHSCTIHGSGPNTTPHRRRGLALHYVRGDFTWRGSAPRPAPSSA
ncbi:MAG TPA: phytanoyl-CoA dioxygenase family protein, partial [Acidimicrobiales bacterium]|nr:phytanoyl-CoA dioxygenase family protein [Acidimicrobiales bacterium]